MALISSGVEPAQLWRAYSESGLRALGLRTHTEGCLFQKSECTSLSHGLQDRQPLPAQSGFTGFTNFGWIFQVKKQLRFPVFKPHQSTIAKWKPWACPGWRKNSMIWGITASRSRGMSKTHPRTIQRIRDRRLQTT